MFDWILLFGGMALGAWAMRRHMLRTIREDAVVQVNRAMVAWENGLLDVLRRNVYDGEIERHNREVA